MRRAMLCWVMVMGISLAGLSAAEKKGSSGKTEKKAELPKPSANAGRLGQYNAPTSVGDYSYHVYVPKSYAEDNPAGIHLHFSGQGGCADNSHFGQWAKYFLEPFNLIGVNMKYPDGDNSKNTSGKIAAAIEAVLQVQADYKIIVGRGVICSFSGGGGPHGGYYTREGAEIGLAWPFILQALYGSNYWVSYRPNAAFGGWFIGVGTDEWNMGMPTLGDSSVARSREVFASSPCLDNYFHVTKHGHNITDDEVEAAARIFRRLDLAFAPFIYEKDFTEAELKPIVKSANALDLAKAEAAVTKLLAKEGLAEAIKAKAEKLQATISKRIAAVCELCQTLKDDAVLADYYEPIFTKQLKGHEREKEIKDLFAEIRKNKDSHKALALYKDFQKNFRLYFKAASPRLEKEAIEFFEKVKAVCGEQSEFGRMAAEYLAVQ